MPSDAILKEEGAVPPMPLDAFVKEEAVPPDATTKEEEAIPPTLPGVAIKPEQEAVVKESVMSCSASDGSASGSDAGFPEPNECDDLAAHSSLDHNEEEAHNRLQQQLDLDRQVLQQQLELERQVLQQQLELDKFVQLDQQEAWRVASLSNEENSLKVAQKLGGSVAEQQKVLDVFQAQASVAQLYQIVDAFDRGSEAVAALLQAGVVDINAVSLTLRWDRPQRDRVGIGNTALHVAVMRGRTALVRLLLEHGADASIKNGTDKTAAHLASKTKLELGRGKYDRPRAGCAGCLALLTAHAKTHGASVASAAAGEDAAGSSMTSGATSGSSKKPTAAKKRAGPTSCVTAAGSEAADVAMPAAAPAVFASVLAALPAASVADLKIGSRVCVWWEDDDAWYAGTVKSCSRTRGVCVVFDKQDGEDDCTMYYESFAEEKWKMARAALPPPPLPSPAAGASSKAQGKKRMRA